MKEVLKVEGDYGAFIQEVSLYLEKEGLITENTLERLWGKYDAKGYKIKSGLAEEKGFKFIDGIIKKEGYQVKTEYNPNSEDMTIVYKLLK